MRRARATNEPLPDPDRPSSVCLITGEYPPSIGGIADYTASLAGALREAGLRVAVCTTRGSGVSSAHRGPGIHTVEVPDWRVPSLGQIAATVVSVQPDVIHLQYQAAAFDMSPAILSLPFLLRARLAVPFVTTFHDLRPPYLFPKAGPVRRWFTHALIGASDAVVFTDPGDLARAHPRRPAFWIPIGSSLVPGPPIDPGTARRRFSIGPDEVVVGCFGFANASKGMDVLLRAAERLVRAQVPLRLLLIGDEVGSSDPRNRDTAAAMRELARALDLERCITRTGHLAPEEVSVAMAAADVAALPYTDGASLRRSSLLACLAHGLPVVTTEPAPTPAVPPHHAVPPFDTAEALRIDRRVVATVPRGDDAALAREIYRLLDDPPRRRALAAAGPALVRLLDWRRIAQATISVYHRARVADAR